MDIVKQIAQHFRELHYGGNWTCVNLKDTLADVTWQQATTQVYNLNTIATLTYHTHYFVHAVLQVLRGGPLDAHDKLSFSHPPINSKVDWDAFLATVWADADSFADLVEQLSDTILDTTFSDEKYGTYYRNLQGIIEHTHYHLGQIVVVKKILGENLT
jgi:hypothetical protein